MDTHAGSPGTLKVADWGRTRYADAFERQKELVGLRRSEEASDTLVFTEHEPVYTIGLRKGAAQHLIWSDAACAERGIEIHQSNRGGDITYHGPGQIVGYPIISLQEKRDLHAYLRDLEQVVINTLAVFRLDSDRREGKTGIWLGERKICAIGVAVRTWVTYHGFALNVSPNMEHFQGIVPCGITDGTVTSMEYELKRTIDMENVKAALAVEFQRVFQNTSSNNG
ncbi:MAG: lipoyl(octanoyl) transferase LipB [Opitutaceae bacterium]